MPPDGRCLGLRLLGRSQRGERALMCMTPRYLLKEHWHLPTMIITLPLIGAVSVSTSISETRQTVKTSRSLPTHATLVT
jgi:hypothetical protein